MKQIVLISLRALLPLCLLITQRAFSQPSQVTVQPDSSHPSFEELRSAFSILGLVIERFSYAARFDHTLHLQLLEYRKGKLEKSSYEETFVVGAGAQSFTVYAHDNAGSLRVSIGAAQARRGWPPVALNGFNANAWGTFDVKVYSSKRAPLFYFAANRGGITSTSNSENPDSIASDYDLCVIITAQIKKR